MIHEQKCTYCKKVTHKCDSDRCVEPDIGICGSEENPTECYYKLTIDIYKSQLDEAKQDNFDLEVKRKKLVAINNQFRTMLLGPRALETLIHEGAFDVSTIKMYISKARLSWEEMSLETCIMFVNAHQEFARGFADLIGTKHAKVSIKKELIKRSAEESKKATKFVEKEKEDAADAAFFKTAKGKAVKANMKNFKGMSKEDAIKLVESMGIK